MSCNRNNDQKFVLFEYRQKAENVIDTKYKIMNRNFNTEKR